MKNQLEIPLYNALKRHISNNPVSFHVPGHKFGEIAAYKQDEIFKGIVKIDATELTGLDDLHSPEGPIKEAEELLAELYGSKKSYFLVNGSTVGNLAMIMAVCREDSTVLVQRNCHKSVLNALKLAKVRPVFLEPEIDQDWKVAAGISTKTVQQAINQYPDAKALILTYPNYYGMVDELKGIIELAHLHQIPVLVDEAHGPHFIIGDPFPPSALQLGADVVVHSAHKTLPAMTMGSFLHVNGNLVNLTRIEEYLGIFQSSSPSYPIMASLDISRYYLAGYQPEDVDFLLFEIQSFKEALAKIESIKVLTYPMNEGDPLKITIQSKSNLTGFEVQKKFEANGIYTELADPYNVLFILPLLKKGQVYPLSETAAKIKSVLAGMPFNDLKEEIPTGNERISELAIRYSEMEKLNVTEVKIERALGLVSADTIIPYPPGIPLLMKGERITSGKIGQLNRLLQTGARFQGDVSLLKAGYLKAFSIT
ncbi:aminotransferase class I/II-fold pyridoxal phosphate-dependent enzyme [Neobacillus drentensis]|uniref:aminotransferase class I/II-fold pyridoxal phosphate-dependent enzyme n=1 Tax=Neobacillus drentensis TaxID=220684 RepID=UPI001F48CF77|nr:aminotransferase class I/II-fold pyridoxal phosphate-dependent enzyme [Neobacillus drentensis]ULT57107.1 aminotransferase class I/II-fold pyridoxal phosphate-dependent enzyme [Neobacillus drentensis]